MRKIILPLADDWRETGIDGYLANSAAQIQGRFGRVLRPWVAGTGKGYLYVTCSGVGNRAVHVLVCTAFHGPKPEGMEVAHDDGDNFNNRPSNLRWDTPLGNGADRIKHGTTSHGGASGEANAHAVLTADLVREIRAADEPYLLLALRFGVSISTIRDIRKRRSWVHI